MLADGDAYDSGAHPKGFDTITLRISRDVMQWLRKQSGSTGISMNALVNQVLRHYVEWDSFESRMGMIPFPKNVLGHMLDELTEDQITKLASRIGKDTAIDMAMFMKGRIDIFDFVAWIEARMQNSGFQVEHKMEGRDHHTVMIKHDLGKKWSLYLKIMLESCLAGFFKKPSEFFVSDSMVSASFR